MRFGIVDRIHSDGSIIVRDMFKKETDLSRFMLLPVLCENGASGRLTSRFGQGGKAKVAIEGPAPSPGQRVCMMMKKFSFSNNLA
jgi:hypothetical protein